jgi:NAD-dependent SIR2 family protein deacetylase
VVVLVGAGASVSAGIPDFRTPGTGLYDRLQKYNLPFPEAIFDLNYYRTKPTAFVDLCQSIWPGQKDGPKSTLAHAFMKVLQDKGCLRRIYTQNIDGLEALAGVSTEHLVECHGHFRTASCISCQAPMEATDCQETMFRGEIPKCSSCGSPVKPDIVFFGEEMPARFQQLVHEDVASCDLLLVMGTSLLVMPVAGIPSWVDSNCPRVLLNRELVGDFVYSKDLYVPGDCDDSVKKICELAGWEQELKECYEEKQ